MDERLLNITPPESLTRFPRSLTEMSHFKAAELSSLLQCIVFIRNLPMDHFNHVFLLVYAIYVFLQQKITATEILKCRKYLLKFVINVLVLYGTRYMTSNVHLFLYLADSRRHGTYLVLLLLLLWGLKWSTKKPFSLIPALRKRLSSQQKFP